MKKIITLSLALLLVLSLVACGGNGVDETYALTSVEAMGVSLTIDEFTAETGMDMSGMKLQFKKNGKVDGQFVDTTTGEMTNGTSKYEITDTGFTITDPDGSTYDVVKEGDTLTWDIGGATLVFTLQA